jgi:hypothetical protein
MSGTIHPLPNTPSWLGAQLKHRDNFTFYNVCKTLRIPLIIPRYEDNIKIDACGDVNWI